MPPVSSRTTSRSVPSMRSRLSGLASRSAGLGRTGRMFANRPSSLRRPSRPCSGRAAPGSVLSHLGPPTAASSTASALRQLSSTSSVSGTPCASIEAPPISSSSMSKSPTAASSRLAASMISGPMPSPGSRTRRGVTYSDTALAGRASQRGRDRTAALALGLVAVDRVLLLERHADVVEALEQPVPQLRVDLEPGLSPAPRDLLGGQLDRGVAGLHHRPHLVLLEHHGQQTDLGAVRVEDVREAGRDNRLEAVVLEGPRSVLARRATTEVASGGQDRIPRQVPSGLLRPVIEEELAESSALHPLEELLRDDLVGIDVAAVERGHAALDRAHLPHSHSLMSTKCPSMAAAAAIFGLTRCERAPRPCRPSKLRFDVEATRSPGAAMSGFIPRHIEQPAERQAKPAARNTSSRPSASACAFTCCDPGTTIASTLDATRRPRTSSAASRRSPMREFVQEPMNTRSSRISDMGVPGSSAMYSSARSSPSPPGSGTAPVTPTTMPGVVPHVTWGEISDASTSTSLSKLAPSSLRSARQSAVGRGSGAASRPSTHSKVVSSGAIMPARPPASIVMLQTVMRPSMDSRSIAGPAYSITWPTPPSTPICPIVARMRSLPVTPWPSSPW